MLKKIKRVFRKKSELRITPGEAVRDKMIEVGLKTAQESGYAAGNATEKFVKIAEIAGGGFDWGTKIGGGCESSRALGRIVFKATKDIARRDGICTGLCTVSATCETIALGCSTIKLIPYRGKIYIFAKIISNGCMSYRNLCAGEGC